MVFCGTKNDGHCYDHVCFLLSLLLLVLLLLTIFDAAENLVFAQSCDNLNSKQRQLFEVDVLLLSASACWILDSFDSWM